jgi:alanine dehydrogenase
MTIGTPKEQKTDEFRVGLTPANVASLVGDGHSVLIQKSAGEGSGFSDSDYDKAGAKMVSTLEEVYASAKLIVKVKEPQALEYDLLNDTHTLFCYLHLAPIPKLVTALLKNEVCAIAYETVAVDNHLPLLQPMSEIAGRMAPMVAAEYLSRYKGGEGILISGAEGVAPANVLVIGAGNAGFNAATIAHGMGAKVTVLNRSTPKLKKLLEICPDVKTAIYSEKKLREELVDADIVISPVLIHGGATTPKLITREMLKTMKKGSILVDVTIDQGGISEASRPTTHRDATFVEEGVLHYCVANMPGAYPKTATLALCKATFPYVSKLANEGTVDAIKNSPSLGLGVNVYKGEVTNKAVGEVQGLEFRELEGLI